jgi:predicted AlkP superfamily phosphohydrolase/phosphomutase
VRLDVASVALAAYVGGHALLGAAAARAVARLRRGGEPLGTLPRLVALGILLAACDALGFGAVWRHRELPVALGLGLAAAAGAAGAAAGGVLAFLATALLHPRANALAARLLPLAVIAWGAATLAAAGRGSTSPRGEIVESFARIETGVKVAILGVDGLDGRIVRRAIAEGRLPNLARLMEEGTSGPLRSIRPPKSPVVWTSIATGMLPEVHGIKDFLVRSGGARIPVTGNLRRSAALWNMAEPAGFTVAFVNWYVTWPAEAVAGVIISDRADFDGLERRVFPEEYTVVVDSVRARIDALRERDASRFVRSPGDFDMWKIGRWGQVRRSLGILDDVIRHDLVTLESARAALAGGQPDLTALYFRGNDNTQHLFWKYRLAEHNAAVASLLYDELEPDDVQRLGAVVDRYYDFADELIGEVLAMLDPGTAVMVLSDHGFLTNNERGAWYHPNRLLAAAGLAELVPGGGGAADSSASAVYEAGRPTASAVRALRPGGGAQDPREALERAKSVLEAIATDRGERVFDSVSLAEDAQGPLLEATFAGELAGDSARVGDVWVRVRDVRTPEGHSGDHAMDGFLLGCGAPFARGATIEGARCVDVAPTVLHLLGAPAALDMEGVVLEEMLDAGWAERHPVRLVRSWGEREGGGEEAISTDADERIREELEALGYIR